MEWINPKVGSVITKKYRILTLTRATYIDVTAVLKRDKLSTDSAATLRYNLTDTKCGSFFLSIASRDSLSTVLFPKKYNGTRLNYKCTEPRPRTLVSFSNFDAD